jgi:hypothetical protein
MRLLLFVLLFLPALFHYSNTQQQEDYSEYHRTIQDIEKSIVAENYKEALDLMEEISNSYEFVFLRDYKIATQLAIYLKDFQSAFKYLKLGISNGWTLKEIKKNKFMKALTSKKEWSAVEDDYKVLRIEYDRRINDDLRREVKEMYKKDQKFAMKYLSKIGQKAKERYGNKKGVPHAQKQIAKLREMIKSQGYPGEKLIGGSEWITTILAHHNSVSKEFVVNDTLYPSLRPKLLRAIDMGEMNPYNFAFIEDWKIAVESDRQDTGYGYLDLPTEEEISKSNKLRHNLNIRSIETRNSLVDIQEKTGMNFYLAGKPWVDGKIISEN